MGRAYAGILGPLAFVTVVARCLVHGGDTDATWLVASLMLFVFSALGYIIGSVAERTIVEAIGNQLRASRPAPVAAQLASRSPDAFANSVDAT